MSARVHIHEQATLAELTGSKRKRYKTADGSVLGADGKSIGRLYEQWKKRSKRRVGEAEDGDDVGRGNDVSMWDERYAPVHAGNKAAKQELQGEAHLRKERAKAARVTAAKAKKKYQNSRRGHMAGVEKKNRRARSKIKRGQAPSRAKMIVKR